MKVAFAGTPEFAATALRKLNAAGLPTSVIMTQPDRPAGRGLKLQASAVKRFGLERGLAVLQPRGLRLDGRYAEDAAAARARLESARPDVMVVAAYGLILPSWVLSLPRHGCINIHASLLPRWRGAAPIHRAIEAGDAETGVTLMQMDEGLDTGALLLVERTPIDADDSTATLQARLAELGGGLAVRGLRALAAGGDLPRTPQSEAGVSYARKVLKDEAGIDWNEPAEVLERRVRAFDPFPGAQSVLQGGVVKVWRGRVSAATGAPGEVLQCDSGLLRVACGTGALDLLELQRPGGRRLTVAEFLRNSSVRVGLHFAPAAF